MDKALSKAIEAVGGTAALARELEITSQAVSQWKQVPVERVRDVERLSGVSRYELRPDIYGPELAQPTTPKRRAADKAEV